MVGEVIYCSGCGITLMPFMKVCPRCGTPRENATSLEQPAPTPDPTSNPTFETSLKSAPEPDAPPAPNDVEATETAPAPQPQTDVVPLNAIRQQRLPQGDSEFAPPLDVVFLSPSDTQRRFPIFTSAQWTLIVIGICLLILMSVIAFLLWRQQKHEVIQTTSNPVVMAQPAPGASPSIDPNPTPVLLNPVDDQTITEAVKSALLAYNPLGFSRYKFEVKDGVVTINGETEHQPEKDGAENVIKLVSGVKSVVNNLKVKPEEALTPVKVNAAEAKVLDDALKRQILADEQVKTDQHKQPQPDPQREAERQRRELAAAKQREEEAALRKAAEDKLKHEAEEYEKRQEELRRAEAERRSRAEQARLEAGALRSGTVAWSGIVDGVDEIIFSGGSASVRHISGNAPREVRTSFSAPIPRSPASVNLLSISGRTPVQITQQPSAANGYTTIVRIDDSSKGGEKLYEFTLRWVLQ